MRRGIIYARSREDSSMPPWKQLILLFQYAKDINFLDMGVIATMENDNRHDRDSIQQLHTMLKKHDCNIVMVMDSQCLSDDPAELALIQKRFEEEHIVLYELFPKV